MTNCFHCDKEIDKDTLLTGLGPVLVQVCNECRKTYWYKIKRINEMYYYEVNKIKNRKL